MIDERLDSIATFQRADTHPERAWIIQGLIPGAFIPGSTPWLPRQLLKPAYQLNGAIYAYLRDKLPKTGASILFGKMGAEIVDGTKYIDIDTLKDFAIADTMLKL